MVKISRRVDQHLHRDGNSEQTGGHGRVGMPVGSRRKTAGAKAGRLRRAAVVTGSGNGDLTHEQYRSVRFFVDVFARIVRS
jgi:hypothetical protein